MRRPWSVLPLVCALAVAAAGVGPGNAAAAAAWSGDFETGDLSQWPSIQACPGDVAVVTSPVRAGRYAARFTVRDESVTANCPAVPTSGTRASLASPRLFGPGDDAYIGFSSYFPAGFPAITTGWLQVAEVYGPPYNGPPSIGLAVNGNRLVLTRDNTHNVDAVWTSLTGVAKGTGWEDIVLHVKFSTDPSVGFVELWHNGQRQRFTDGTQTLHYSTIVPGVNGGGPNSLFLNQYRSKIPARGAVTLYHDEGKVGSSYAAVAPANQPPTVTLTSPAAGSPFGSTLRFAATAGDDRRVVRVEFWLDERRLRTDHVAPYAYSYHPARKAGVRTHTATARAYDAQGLAASDAVTVTGSPSAATAGVHAHTATGQLSVSGPARRKVSVTLTSCSDRKARIRGRRLFRRLPSHGRATARVSRGTCVLGIHAG
jgi:hypothetical protein